MANSPVSNLPIVALSDVPDANALSSSLTTALDHITVPKYATTAARDAANTAPTTGDICYVTGTGRGYYSYGGSGWLGPYQLDQAWQTWTPTWSTSTGSHTPSIGNGVYTCRYFQMGKLVTIIFQVVFGSTTNFGSSVTGSDNWTFTLPVSATVSFPTNMMFSAQPSNATAVPVWASVDSSGLLEFGLSGARVDGTAAANTGNLDSITPASGLWTSGSKLAGGGQYVAA